MKLIYIGNVLSRHGVNPTTVETLSTHLSKDFDVVISSDKLNKLHRIIDMVMSIIRHNGSSNLVLIDTYSTSNFYFALVCAFVSKIFGIPYIPILHGGSLPDRLKNSPTMTNWLFRNSIFNVAPSRYLQNEFDKHELSSVYIPNTIELTDYKFTLRKNLRPKLLYVRAFASIYNPTLAIKVMARLLEVYPNASLCMVGPEKDESLSDAIGLAKKLGVNDSICFKGHLSKEEWHFLSSDFDIFINTTNVDNTPVSIVEAMALGLPVVSTDAGGIPFLIRHEIDGLISAKGDDKEMFDNIIRILNNNELASRIAQNARSNVERFAWKEVRKVWLDKLRLTNKS